MKPQSINFLQKIPPFFKGIKLQISVLLCSIGLFAIIYIFYKNSNEVKMQEINFDISSNNQLDSCAFNIGFNMAGHISLEKKYLPEYQWNYIPSFQTAYDTLQ